jgi:hypothetical protein
MEISKLNLPRPHARPLCGLDTKRTLRKHRRGQRCGEATGSVRNMTVSPSLRWQRRLVAGHCAKVHGRMLGDASANASVQIVAAILAAGGQGNGARSAVMPRVRGNLAYLHKQEEVVKSGDGSTARWSLA